MDWFHFPISGLRYLHSSLAKSYVGAAGTVYIVDQANRRRSKVYESLVLVDKFHQQASWTGPNVQSTQAQDLNGLVGVQFLEFERNGAISRSHYPTPFSGKGRLTTTLLESATLLNLVTLLKISNVPSSKP